MRRGRADGSSHGRCKPTLLDLPPPGRFNPLPVRRESSSSSNSEEGVDMTRVDARIRFMKTTMLETPQTDTESKGIAGLPSDRLNPSYSDSGATSEGPIMDVTSSSVDRPLTPSSNPSTPQYLDSDTDEDEHFWGAHGPPSFGRQVMSRPPTTRRNRQNAIGSSVKFGLGKSSDRLSATQLSEWRDLFAKNFDDSAPGNEYMTAELIRARRIVDAERVELALHPTGDLTLGNNYEVTMVLYQDMILLLTLDTVSGKYRVFNCFDHSGILPVGHLACRDRRSRHAFALVLINGSAKPTVKMYTILFSRQITQRKWTRQIKDAVQNMRSAGENSEAVLGDRINRRLASLDISSKDAAETFNSFYNQNPQLTTTTLKAPPLLRGNYDSETGISGVSDARTPSSNQETDIDVALTLTVQHGDTIPLDDQSFHCQEHHQHGDLVVLDMDDEHRDRWPLVAKVVQVDINRRYMRIRWLGSCGIYEPFDTLKDSRGRRNPSSILLTKNHFICGFSLDENDCLPRHVINAICLRAKEKGIDMMNRKPKSTQVILQTTFKRITRNTALAYQDVPRSNDKPRCRVLPEVHGMVLIDLGGDYDENWPLVAKVSQITDNKWYCSYDGRGMHGKYTRWRHQNGKGGVHALRKVRTNSHYICSFTLQNTYYLPEYVKEKARQRALEENLILKD